MNNLLIKPTNNTPYVSFEKNGILRIEGRSYPHETINFFQPLFEWANEYRGNKTEIFIKLEYFNTSTCKQLLSLLRMIIDNNEKNVVKIIWFYEENDLDVLEIGEHMKNILKTDFIFKPYVENKTFKEEF